MKKFPLLIQIQWHAALEIVLIESTACLNVGNIISTSELWFEDQSQITYAPRIKNCERSGTQYKIQLHYDPKEHPNLFEIIDTWGNSLIAFDVENVKHKPVAEWRNEPKDTRYDGPATKVKVIRPGTDEFLGYAAALRKIRRQDLFKRQLLTIERKCALSGECEQSVLDAAHIKDVRSNGSFSSDNGFLLRTDVHRLFDRGLLIIDPESGKASLSDSVPKSSPYWGQVEGWHLDKTTLGRVKDSLITRYKNGG